MIIILQDRKRKLLHVTCRTVTWWAKAQFAVVWEKNGGLVLSFKEFCPMSYSSFPPALERGFFPKHTDSHSPCNTDKVDSARSMALLSKPLWYHPPNSNWPEDTVTHTLPSHTDRCITSAGEGWCWLKLGQLFFFFLFLSAMVFLWQKGGKREQKNWGKALIIP